ncbi:MAG: pseudouridine synthase [Rhodobacteraceae bacterium]|nr:pseudouridine synthase [Paracoccaceae bacterium]
MSDENSKGERIAKAMARAGVASRRDAEKMILDGRVAVNGTKVASPALDVLPSDKITLDGKPIDAPQPARLWLYYKPVGLVTSAKDEKGRQTVFDTMPEGMPRVMSVGRLDLTSEGLLLLTNDGELKRKLELPTTGWLRKYRVRVNGRPNDATFDPLRRGVTIEGEDFQPMEITLDKQQGANAWLTVGLREGKNREIRRAMAEVGLTVNRLIRVSYGPFRLNTMKPGDVVEVKQRVLRDQLGDGRKTDEDKPEKPARHKGKPGPRPDRPRRDGDKPGPRAADRGTDKPRRFDKGRDDKRANSKDAPGKPRPERKGAAIDGAPRRERAEAGDRPARHSADVRPRRDDDARPRGAGFGKGKPRRDSADERDRKPRGVSGKGKPDDRRNSGKPDDAGRPRKPYAGKGGSKGSADSRPRRDGPASRPKGKGPGPKR